MKLPRFDRKLGPELPRFSVKGVRTDAWSQREMKVDVLFELKVGVLRIIEGGTTGHESLLVQALPSVCRGAGWLASAGTRGKWDRLFIPSGEMRRAEAFFRPYFDSVESDVADRAEEPKRLKNPEDEEDHDDDLK